MKCVAGRVDRRRPSNAKTVDPPERLRASGEKNCGNRREGNPSWQPCLARSSIQKPFHSIAMKSTISHSCFDKFLWRRIFATPLSSPFTIVAGQSVPMC
jgi:hypothetical protein